VDVGGIQPVHLEWRGSNDLRYLSFVVNSVVEVGCRVIS
jgi:hypothetical protein